MSSLFTNPLIAALQAVGWLFFRPSRWRRWVTNIAPDLAADFAFSQLKKTDFQQRETRYLLGLTGLIGPLLVFLWSLAWLVLKTDMETALRGAVYAAVLTLLGGLLAATLLSVAFGLVAGVAGGLAAGVLFAWESHPLWPGWMLSAGLFALGLGSGVLVSLHERSARYSRQRQFAAIVGSLSVAALILLAGAFAALYFLGDLFQPQAVFLGGGGMGIGLIFGLYTRRWGWGAGMAVLCALLMAGASLLAPYADEYPTLNAVVGATLNGLVFPVLFVLPYLWARDLGGPDAGIVAGLLGSGCGYVLFLLQNQGFLLPVGLVIAALAGVTQSRWRPLLSYPFELVYNRFLYRREITRHPGVDAPLAEFLLTRNAAFWDELQTYRLYGLEEHLLWVAEHSPPARLAAFESLADTPQQWAVQAAQRELYLRVLQRADHIAAIRGAWQSLPADSETVGVSNFSLTSAPQRTHDKVNFVTPGFSTDGYLKHFHRISRDIAAAFAWQDAHSRHAALAHIETSLSRLQDELTLGAHADVLRRCAVVWKQAVHDAGEDLARHITRSGTLPNPYITGVPLRPDSGLFVGRSEAVGRLERLLRESGSPPVLLYGRRRMGKTSLLNHLGRMLPGRYLPVLLDLQAVIPTVQDHADFFEDIMSAIAKTMPGGPPLPGRLRENPFRAFRAWLDAVEQQEPERIFLLSFDEYEYLHDAFSAGKLDQQDTLSTFRALVQHRPRFRILLSGAHPLADFPGWAGYWINAETISLDYLTAEEARRLIEQPRADFPLRYSPDALQRVIALTRGHPALLQYLCQEIVSLKNRQPLEKRRSAAYDDVEAAIRPTLESAANFFAYLQERPAEETALLGFIARQPGAVSRKNLYRAYPEGDLEVHLSRLVRDGLLEFTTEGDVQFQVELMRIIFSIS